ncbi:MAG: sigma-70 family RNA polymerase sigma factor [Vicinamibacteria bacterium]|nr:sigma-70 family RNA polymerase sigma factor [Vicinamibacteria bacterium]
MTRDERFRTVYDSSARQWRSLARGFARGPDQEDLFQDMVLQIWRTLDSFKGAARPETWAYRVALNTAISFRRRTLLRDRHRADVASPDDTPDTTGSAGGRDEMAVLAEFLETLPDVDRALLALYLEDLSYREMADITGLSDNHVGVRLHQIKKRFTERYVGRTQWTSIG